MRPGCKFFTVLVWLQLSCILPAVAQKPDTSDDFSGVMDPAVLDAEYSGDPRPVVIYNSARPSPAQWERATADDAYSYRTAREYVPKQEPRRKIPGWYQLLIRFFEFLSSPNGKLILWSALALIVGYIGYRLLAGGSRLFAGRDRKRPDEGGDPGQVSEDGLLRSNWEDKLRAALAAGDTQLAIRYSYMHTLQALQMRGFISYRADKTNATYFLELTEALRGPFRAISRQYEYAWYGNFLPDATAMDAYMQTYDSLTKSIADT